MNAFLNGPWLSESNDGDIDWVILKFTSGWVTLDKLNATNAQVLRGKIWNNKVFHHAEFQMIGYVEMIPSLPLSSRSHFHVLIYLIQLNWFHRTNSFACKCSISSIETKLCSSTFQTIFTDRSKLVLWREVTVTVYLILNWLLLLFFHSLSDFSNDDDESQVEVETFFETHKKNFVRHWSSSFAQIT